MTNPKPTLPDAGRLSKLTGHDKAVVDEMVRDIQQSHPQATREGILEDLEAWGFDPTYEQLEAEKPTREDILKAAKHDPILAGMVERRDAVAGSLDHERLQLERDEPVDPKTRATRPQRLPQEKPGGAYGVN